MEAPYLKWRTPVQPHDEGSRTSLSCFATDVPRRTSWAQGLETTVPAGKAYAAADTMPRRCTVYCTFGPTDLFCVEARGTGTVRWGHRNGSDFRPDRSSETWRVSMQQGRVP